MARKKKKNETKIPRALRDIQSAIVSKIDRPESRDIPQGAAEIGRLDIHPQTFPRDPAAIASAIRFSKHGSVFCDSTVFIAPTEPEIWEALLEGRRATIIYPLISELKWWLGDIDGNNPNARKFVEESIAASSSAGSGPIRIIHDLPSHLRLAMD